MKTYQLNISVALQEATKEQLWDALCERLAAEGNLGHCMFASTNEDGYASRMALHCAAISVDGVYGESKVVVATSQHYRMKLGHPRVEGSAATQMEVRRDDTDMA